MESAPPSAEVFRAVADPTRRAILDLLLESDRSVSELAVPFKMSQPAISQHLKVLREAGLVADKRAGRQRIYRLDRHPLADVYSWAARYVSDPSGHVWGLTHRKRPHRR
jgi:DNA-binding transcriptional ArsR family regulator